MILTPQLVKLCKTKLKDTNENELAELIKLGVVDTVQLKYDGWWVLCVWHGNKLYLYSATARELAVFDVATYTDTSRYFIGEYIYGTNWSLNANLPYKLYLHDAKQKLSGDLRYLLYRDRLAYIKDNVVKWKNSDIGIVESWPITSYKDLWNSYVLNKGYEGLVFKSSVSREFGSLSRQFRMKKSVEMDYVCIRVNEGKGRLEGTMGSIDAGLIVNGKFVDVCSVGGGFTDSQRHEIWINSKQYIGKVFTATGKQLFSSGALRHPAFDRWRFDKQANDCIFSADEE